MKHLGRVALLICLVAAPLCAWAGPPKTLEQNLEAAGRFKTYLELQKLAGPGKSSLAKGPRTYLVPNDAAFAALPAGELAKLKADPAQIRKLLASHTLPGRVTVANMVGAKRSESHKFKSDGGITLGFVPAPPAPAPVIETAPVGETGSIGETGPTGEMGQMGATGPVGEIGPVGELGPVGETGPVGEIAPSPAPAPDQVTPVIIPQPNLYIAPPPEVAPVDPVAVKEAMQVILVGMTAIEPILIQLPPTLPPKVAQEQLVVTGGENLEGMDVNPFKEVQIVAEQTSLSGGGFAYELSNILAVTAFKVVDY